MCGIAGYLGRRELPSAALQACLGLMGRRGPDHAGLVGERTPDGRILHLLHTRLSIIDLNPRSNQPFLRDGAAMAFNGELYNYVELKAELEAKGERFVTDSDTEVLMALVARQGWAGLDRAEGMWAFAHYESAGGELVLCRDRFGEKPLYLHRACDGIYFGSEPKFIFALMGKKLPVNLDQVRRYLVNGYKSLYKNGQTFFLGLEELPAAHLLRLGSGGESLHRYWEARLAPQEEMTFSQAVEGTRERLIQSVRLRLRADVPLAFCLSGGIDSNALISIARRVLGHDVHGFTIMNTDRRYDEREMVEAAVKAQGFRHTAIDVTTADFLPRLREQVRYHDGPICTITYYAHQMLLEAVAREGYRISISGSGADELFSGYYDHHNAYLAQARGDDDLFAQALADWRTHIRPIVRNPFLLNPLLFVAEPGFRDHIYLDAAEFAAFLRHYEAEPFAEEDYCQDLLRNRMLNELFHEAVPPILHEDDLNAMYWSVENRSPFLDRRLFEFTLTIPTRHLIREGRAKAVLREAVRGIAPDVILDNPRKVGFNAPIFSFLDVDDPAVRGYLLDDSPIFEVVRRESIADLIAQASLPNSRSKFLFYFLASKMFLEELG
jgi:asparagine synthase (glutamine-hydrolysing)